ncbi:terpenoid synthase [Lactarius quietus]|nr:terpenoid synthase [Lactarius quietus]
MPEGYYIPKTLENWKWPRRINPHHDEIHAEATEWIKSFERLKPKTLETIDGCNFNLLASLFFPSHEKAHLRTCCDFLNLAPVFEEISDSPSHEDEVQDINKAAMSALFSPHTRRPKNEWVGVEVTRQFWERAMKTASPQAQKRIIKAIGAHTKAQNQRSADRRHQHIRSIEEYFEIRRDSIAARPCLALIKLDMNLPDEVVQHPIIEEMATLAIDMFVLDNDMLSYNVERTRGEDGHNIITIVMHQHKTDIKGAMNWVCDYHKELESKFMDLYETKIPKFGEPVDTELAQYVDGIGNIVRANYQWSFETERYFGKSGPEIEKTRWVTLLPKEPEAVTNC